MTSPDPSSARTPSSSARARGASPLGRALIALGAALVPLSVAWTLTGGGSESGVAPSPAVPPRDPGLESALAAEPLSAAASARKPAKSASERIAALRHPLVGASRRALIRALGPPTRRTTEGGAAMELLEYELGGEEYQVVVLDGRVVEVTRFR